MAFIWSLALLAASGCKVGPDYHRPAPLGTNSVAPNYSQADDTNRVEWKTAAPASGLPRDNWWQVFADPNLDRLEELVRADNFQLAAALARYEQARAQVKLARGPLLPQIETDPAFTRQRTSFHQPQNGQPADAAHSYSTFTLPLQAGWELDLWGRIRRQVEAAGAGMRANADDLASIKLALQADVASDYFTLRALDREYDVVTRTAETYRKSLELTVNRRKGGIATDLDVAQAETQLRGAEAELPALRLQRLRLLHGLAALCGQPPMTFSLEALPLDDREPPSIPAGVPSELLERRPDVAAAEERMAAANAQIGVAKAAFYPRVRFDGLAGFQSISAATWLDWPSRFWSVGPTVELPLFTGGQNRARLGLSRAAYDETVANYRQTVLNSFQEVEDQLAAQQQLKTQLAAEAAALSAAQRTLEIANNRYRAGLVTYLEVASAQSSALALERTTVQLRGQKLVAAVGLVRALGGGWEMQAAGRQLPK